MSTGAAIAIAAGALVLVFFVTKKQEQATAMQANKITAAKNSAGLGLGDVLTIGAVGAAGYFGGPKAGLAAFQVSGARL